VATGIKRVKPDCVLMTHQGDGDLASIGTAELIHSANRGEKITIIFVNNAIYGMTGGQMAPTTLIGMKTTTSPLGRQAEGAGYPLRVCELLRELKGVAYLERTAVNNPQNVMKTKRALKKAFQAQLDGLGFSLVEVVSQCPTGWGMLPKDSLEWLEREMGAYFPLGVFKDARAEEPQEVT
jgi:2-oxoglutarate ferredoxin oxidoreductase subunit beta